MRLVALIVQLEGTLHVHVHVSVGQTVIVQSANIIRQENIFPNSSVALSHSVSQLIQGLRPGSKEPMRRLISLFCAFTADGRD